MFDILRIPYSTPRTLSSLAFAYGPLRGTFNGKVPEFEHKNHQRTQMEGMGPLFMSEEPMPDHISGIDGLKDVRVLMAIYEAVRTGKKVEMQNRA